MLDLCPLGHLESTLDMDAVRHSNETTRGMTCPRGSTICPAWTLKILKKSVILCFHQGVLRTVMAVHLLHNMEEQAERVNHGMTAVRPNPIVGRDDTQS